MSLPGAGWSTVPTLPRAVADWIAAGIINGRWAEGDRLNEVAIAAELGISRAPVREAIRVLHAGGLVQHKQRIGAVVNGFSQQTIRDVYAVRAHLESWIIRESIPQLRPDDITRLQSLLAQMAQAAKRGDNEAVFDIGWEFRRLIYSGFANSTALDTVSQLRRRLHSLPQVLRREQSYADANLVFYRELYDQATRKAAEQAAATVADFLRDSGEQMCEIFQRGRVESRPVGLVDGKQAAGPAPVAETDN